MKLEPKRKDEKSGDVTSLNAADYEDNLTNKEIGHLESIFTKQCKKCETIKAP